MDNAEPRTFGEIPIWGEFIRKYFEEEAAFIKCSPNGAQCVQILDSEFLYNRVYLKGRLYPMTPGERVYIRK